MKKNIIYIVIDGFCYNNLNMKIGNKEITPFLNNLIKDSISFEKMYSLAPYTEAAQVTLLGGERPLDNGGYLFGNKNCRKTLFERVKEEKYKINSTYSPYIYSKSYLRGVDRFYYTRLFSIEPLINYRLDYYKNKFNNKILKKEEIIICEKLLKEAFDTWILQCELLLNKNEKCSIISEFINDEKIIKETKLRLKEENLLFNIDKKKYIIDLFENISDHKLKKINTKYVNNKKKLYRKEECISFFLKALKKYQKKYSKITKKQKIDIKYILNKIFQNRNGIVSGGKESIHLLKNYIKHYLNKDLIEYLVNLDEKKNVEVSMKNIFDKFYMNILKNEGKNENLFSFIHVQDFHLPSMFHTYDSNDMDLIKEEFSVAFELLDSLDETYKGNVIAALSARYCDLKLENLFEKLKKSLKGEYMFIVTSDHGYPLYNTPPRETIYNQCYTEAFHIPLIIYDSSKQEQKIEKKIYSSLDGIEFLEKKIKGEKVKIKNNEYILCEYGGPGCPAIYEKKIWYSIITEELYISLECLLEDKIEEKYLKSIYNIKKDPEQKKNLLKKLKSKKEILFYLKKLAKRHEELKENYNKDSFFNLQKSFN